MPIGARYRPALSKLRVTSNAWGSEGTQLVPRFVRDTRAAVPGTRAMAAAAQRWANRKRMSETWKSSLEEKENGKEPGTNRRPIKVPARRRGYEAARL